MKWAFPGFLSSRKKSTPPTSAPNLAPAEITPAVPASLAERLLKDRTVFLGSTIDDPITHDLIARLLFLQMESPCEPIRLLINSPGGLVTHGLAIVDTIKALQSPVHTHCLGNAYSMAAVILCCGATGERSCTPEARIGFTWPVGSVAGHPTQQAEVDRFGEILIGQVAEATGQRPDVLRTLFTRSKFLSSEQARRLRVIDRIETRTTVQ